jgi:acyl dehydratase
MNTIKEFKYKVGDAIPEFRAPPLTRLTLALYCGASGDHNPIHVDSDYARNVAGLDDVIGPGMLTMAYLGRLITNWVPQQSLLEFQTRLLAPSKPGDCIVCTGRITAIEEGSPRIIRLELQAENQDGKKLAIGTAVVESPD